MASGTRGYNGYRGRASKGRVFLAILLGLIILAALAFLLLQENIYYDADGRPHLHIPDVFSKAEEPAPSQPPADVELILEQEAEAKQYRRGIDLTQQPLTMAQWEALAQEEIPCLAVTLKDGDGRMYYPSGFATTGAVKTEADTQMALTRLTGSSVYSIARFNCLHDPITANYYVTARGLPNRKGYIFYDGSNSQWLDPSKPGTQEMLVNQLSEAAGLGFDEILLSELSCPNTGKLENIKFHDRQGTPREFICQLLDLLLETVKPYDVALSVQLPAQVILQGGDEAAGLYLEDIAPRVPYLYAEAEPDQIPALAQAVADAAPECVFVALTDVNAEGHYLLRR